MHIVKTAHKLAQRLAPFRSKGERIGFVPTMGALHEGHLSLVRQARKECDRVVVSIFVNPLQFAPHEDYGKYPRPLSRDQQLLQGAHVDVLFFPNAKEIYPPGFETQVALPNVSRRLCGLSRPHFFQGVATVVLTLLNLVQPNVLYLGEKDFQQQIILKRMIRDLHLPIQVRALPIVREPDGLAMSSRNAYLNGQERQAALILWKTLQLAKRQVRSGIRKTSALRKSLLQYITKEPLARVDYVECCDPQDLEPVEVVKRPTLLALAVHIGKTRLIDNVILAL